MNGPGPAARFNPDNLFSELLSENPGDATQGLQANPVRQHQRIPCNMIIRIRWRPGPIELCQQCLRVVLNRVAPFFGIQVHLKKTDLQLRAKVVRMVVQPGLEFRFRKGLCFKPSVLLLYWRFHQSPRHTTRLALMTAIFGRCGMTIKVGMSIIKMDQAAITVFLGIIPGILLAAKAGVTGHQPG